MKTKTLQIAYGDYQLGKQTDDGEDYAFQNLENKGWVTRDDVLCRVQWNLAHILDTMARGDKLSIAIEVQTQEEGEQE